MNTAIARLIGTTYQCISKHHTNDIIQDTAAAMICTVLSDSKYLGNAATANRDITERNGKN